MSKRNKIKVEVEVDPDDVLEAERRLSKSVGAIGRLVRDLAGALPEDLPPVPARGQVWRPKHADAKQEVVAGTVVDLDGDKFVVSYCRVPNKSFGAKWRVLPFSSFRYDMNYVGTVGDE